MLQTRVILPSMPLRPFVHHYWTMRADRSSFGMNIIPTGCMKWMFHRGNPFVINGVDDSSNVASICGQYNTGVLVRMNGYSDLIFVFFRPYALKVILNMPGDAFMDDNIDMESVGIPGMRELKWRVLECDDNNVAIGYIEEFIMRRLAANPDFSQVRRMVAVCDEIDRHPGVGIDDLSNVACLSERQFRRVFLENVGMTPKQMIRTKRFFFATKAIQALDSGDFTDIVDKLGFTDHSHFNKEFKAFAGMSPTDYLNHIRELKRNDFFHGYRSYHE